MASNSVSRREYLCNMVDGYRTAEAAIRACDRRIAFYGSCNPIDQQAIADTEWVRQALVKRARVQARRRTQRHAQRRRRSGGE